MVALACRQIRQNLTDRAGKLESVARAGTRDQYVAMAGVSIEPKVPVWGVGVKADSRRA